MGIYSWDSFGSAEGDPHPSRAATVTFVQLHGTGTRQIVRIIPQVDDRYMTDQSLLKLYAAPEPEQMLGGVIGLQARKREKACPP